MVRRGFDVVVLLLVMKFGLGKIEGIVMRLILRMLLILGYVVIL